MSVHFGGRGPGHLARIMGGSLSLPIGAIGVWNMSNYATSPRAYVPNTAGNFTAPNSLYSAGRRVFSISAFWSSVTASVTVADDAVTDPDGNTWASTLNFAAEFSRDSSELTIRPMGPSPP